MAGGILELSTYGAQDLFLTGDPHITFFKTVYRRYTNFSMESVRVNFDDSVGFGTTSTLTVPKTGDLAHRMYLEIILPYVDLKRQLPDDDLKEELDQAIEDLITVKRFMKINCQAYAASQEVLEAHNSNASQIIRSVNRIFNKECNQHIVSDFQHLLNNCNVDTPFNYDELSIKALLDVLEDNNQLDSLTIVTDSVRSAVNKSTKTQKLFAEKVKLMKAAHEDRINKNIKFAWVDRVGHSIIDKVEIRIGGDRIDRHHGEFMNVWYELTANRDKQDTYFSMIGNVDELTSFDRTAKPKYRLTIPMNFWFNRHTGSSVPLIALEYHDITVHVKFRNFEDVSYIEPDTKITTDADAECDDLYLDEVPEILGLDLEASMLIDYIYLDGLERRRFAQSAHEYLIEQVQRVVIKSTDLPKQQLKLENFVHPSKELIWLTQKTRYTENPDGTNRNRWDNYSLTDDNRLNPVAFSSMDFHGYTRVPRQDGNYFNYVQPYQSHYTTPSDGINMYTFSLFPEEYQPSASANFSRLSRVLLSLELDDRLDEPFNISVYTRNTNILRFLSGYAALAFHFT